MPSGEALSACLISLHEFDSGGDGDGGGGDGAGEKRGDAGEGGGEVGGGDGGGVTGGGVEGGIIPTNAFTAAISCRRAATSPIKSATDVDVPAMRTSAASKVPEQTSLSCEELCTKVSAPPNSTFGAPPVSSSTA